MSRTPPSAPPKVERKQNDAVVTQSREYELITPLFGGGVEPDQADPVTIIRGSSIRGQLRFWWRATRGGRYGAEHQRMKEDEGKLWGAASTSHKARPSQVQVHVEVLNRGKPFEVRQGQKKLDISDIKSPFGYVAFSLRDKDVHLLEGVSFRLTISFPAKAKAEVEAALWAWETFGGVGARTRRGFGALRLRSIDGTVVALPRCAEALTVIEKDFKKHFKRLKGHTAEEPLFPLLLRKLATTPKHANPIEAWKALVGLYQRFRQYRNGRYGPTFWPEPNAIRWRTQRRVAGERERVDKFPRAAFGLPIIFHFPHRGEPADTTLKGKGHDRLASPLILRPLACADGAVGIAMVLKAPSTPPGGVVLDGNQRGLPAAVEIELSPSEANQVPPLEGRTDVLAAFIDFLNNEGS